LTFLIPYFDYEALLLAAVMLIFGLGFEAKFCGFVFVFRPAIGWPWPDCGLRFGLRDLALVKKIKTTANVLWDYKIHRRD